MGKALELKTRIIEVEWKGPFSYQEIKERNTSVDYGIYVAFGPHNVYGDKVILYVGKAQDRTFAKRIPEHLDEAWYGDEEFYIGRLGGADEPKDSKWGDDIDYVESKMIQYCLPSWNSSKLNYAAAPEDGEAIIISYGLRIKGFPRILADWLCDYGDFNSVKFIPYSNENK